MCVYICDKKFFKHFKNISFQFNLVFAWLTLAGGETSIKFCFGFSNLLYKRYPIIAKPKVCSLLEWSFIISIAVSSDHSQLRCRGFAGSH